MIEIISHPGKPLVKHLREVATSCAYLIEKLTLNFSIRKNILKDLAYIQGAVHDIGKATKNFQVYIKSGGEIINPPKHHALISAYLAKFIADEYLKDKHLEELEKGLLAHFIFTSVKRHHGNVLNFDDELEKLAEKEEDLFILAKNFYEAEVQTILDELLKEIDIKYDWNSFRNKMSALDELFDSFSDFSLEVMEESFQELNDFKRSEFFYLHHLFFSTLLFSDKSDVKLGKNKPARAKHFNFEAVKEFRVKKGWDRVSDKEINKLKNKAYLEGLDNLLKVFRKDRHFYSVTLPTGLGKTITSLSIAMEMKRLLAEKKPRIIITIPFTSIIDQNYEVFSEIFDKPSSSLLLKHHHLSEPLYKANEEDEVRSAEISQFLIETWQSEIVVTTFVQLLESIFTNRKGKLLKLPNLMNSIIILDEVQQIKYELWSLIRTAFKTLGEKFNCYFILMSATQPLIFNPENEITELIPDHRQYFKFFNRTRLINRTSEKVALSEFSKAVIEHHRAKPDEDILVILNTRQLTLECFEEVKSRIDSDKANLYFLSTLITPFERKRIIENIKKPDAKLPNIIISTQLIEAGVDISVGTVFRAMAPLDSIIQAAGRANRYYESECPSNVFLYRIEELEKYSNLIYGTSLMVKTANVLAGVSEVEESEFLGLIEKYFIEIQKQSQQVDCEFLKYLVELKFEDLGKFSLIDYRNTESVFIQLNVQAKEVWEKYVAIYQNQELDIFQKREAFSMIKAQFYDFVINVPVSWDEENIKFDSQKELNFYVSKLESPSIFYQYSDQDFRENTGYQSQDTLL